ncbi:MAG: metal-dependent transcriptional regulator [Gemmatimonadetes bacterium]|nr:metal-dependent transcriptional regulator [Gemmatimonadota bacterium]
MSGLWWISFLILAAVAWFLPRHGAAARLNRWRNVRHRVRVEDTLKHMLAARQRHVAATSESVAGAVGIGASTASALIEEMEREGLLEMRASALSLTSTGRDYALQVVRAHRLWERFLDDETDLPLTAIHGAADRAEHRLSVDQTDRLDAQLGHPPTDPHGDPIPTTEGRIAPFPGVPLTDYPEGQDAEVTHLEDEPPGVFETIVRAGLSRGTRVRVTERRPGLVRLDVDGRTVSLPSVAASNVHVGPVREVIEPAVDIIPLARLSRGQAGEVVGIDDRVRGLTRRRLLDLGVTPGTVIRPELEPLFGRPRAFRIRQTLVALRDEQAEGIQVRPLPAEAVSLVADDEREAS